MMKNKQKLETAQFEMHVFQAAQYFRFRPDWTPREKNNCVSGQARRFKQRKMFVSDQVKHFKQRDIFRFGPT